MAIINKTGITNGSTIQAEHVTRAIDALSGGSTDTVVATGSFTGSFAGSGVGLTGVVSSSFATNAISASFAASSSFAITASYSQNGGNQNLQQVTNNGNTTTNDIYAFTFQTGNGDPGEAKLLEDGTVEGEQFQLYNANTTYSSKLRNDNTTNAAVMLQFPDKPNGEYTIATTDDLTVSASIKTSGSTLYSANPGTSGFSTMNSIFLGTGSGFNAIGASNSNFLGESAGANATNADNSNFLGESAGVNATNASFSNFIGAGAGISATNANDSNFIGNGAGVSATNANDSNFIGNGAGNSAINANNSNFIGESAGANATNASDSNFIGSGAGASATSAFNSNFFGPDSGFQATNASYSTLIGFQVGRSGSWGSIGSNNIIIGTNISLPNARNNSINLGSVIFATGSYSTTLGDVYTGSQANGRVGIAKDFPNSTLDIAGDTTITGSLITSGSRIRNYRTITITGYSTAPTDSILPTDDIILIVDDTTTIRSVGEGNLDVTSFLANSAAGRCVEIVKVKDGSGDGLVLKNTTMGLGLHINNQTDANGTYEACDTLGSSITLMAMGATATGSAWGTGV